MNKPTRWYSDRQEKRVAKTLKGRQTANSGATKWSKGDVVTDDWLIEAKTVTKEQKTFSIKKEWLLKNKEEAFAVGKHYNALVFDFGDGQDYVVVDIKTFKELLEGGEQ